MRAIRCLEHLFVARLPNGIRAVTAAALLGIAAPGAAGEITYDWCSKLAQNIPGLTPAKCMSADLKAAEARSVLGQPLALRDMPARSGSAKVKILALGGIHGDELTSTTVVFDWIDRLERGQHSDLIHWRMLPATNPDGLTKRPATRVNARGVDLNRNFPTDNWEKDSQRYWVKYTGRDPRRFPGPEALSEPETRWIHAEIEAFKPDLIISVHAPFGVLDFDGPPPPPLKVGQLHLHQIGIYPGSLGNYGGLKKNLPVITLELKHAAQAPDDKELDRMWADLTTWIDDRLLRVQTAKSRNEESD